MTIANALAVYKNRPALVTERTADKITIAVSGGGQVKVREKDIEIIHPGPVGDFGGIEGAAAESGAARDAWELLSEADGPVPLRELAELACGDFSPAAAWAAFRLLLDGLYFSGNAAAITARKREDVAADEQKRAEKNRESGERASFLERLRQRRLELPGDGRFMQDVEALAYGKSAKSKTMKDLGRGETPEEAHALLLETGCWTAAVNPHPARFGLSPVSAKHAPGPPPAEDRRDLTGLAAFAIDSPWSHDPDDAVSIEHAGGADILYVHVADPASAVAADSAAEREARDRGATLYLPEGCSRMMADEALPLFALGLAERSPALTFKITLDENGGIAATDIFPSIIQASRLTYENADRLLDDAALRGLFAIAERSLRRRRNAGAVTIEMPETHISVERGIVSIEPIVPYRSADMVRECMLIAGEGAGLWAAARGGTLTGLPFPYVSQEVGDLPDEALPGMAGSYQLRRCMRPRTLSTKPARHWGLGLDTYTQVTSPLRRYTDLLAHTQIRAALRGGEPLSADEVSARLAAGEAAAAAVAHAERASRAHWTAVYLSDKKDSQWDAVALDQKGGRWTFMIPALALETQVPLRKETAPNERVTLILKSVNIPKGEAVFTAGE